MFVCCHLRTKVSERHGYSEEVFDQFLCDFASQLQNLGLSVDEFNLVEQSRTAYLLEVMQKEMQKSLKK